MAPLADVGCRRGKRNPTEYATMNRARYLTWLAAAAIIVSWLAAVACSEVVDVPVVRQVSETGLLGEMASRMPARYANEYKESRPVSCAHYYAHALNAYIRNQHGGTNVDNASYMPGGKAMVLPEPKGITLSQVAARGGGYFPARGGRSDPFKWWLHQPLYVLDELSAYSCGTAAGIEAGPSACPEAQTSHRFARDMLRHGRALEELCRETSYRHSDELDWFLDGTEEFLKTLESHLSNVEE